MKAVKCKEWRVYKSHPLCSEATSISNSTHICFVSGMRCLLIFSFSWLELPISFLLIKSYAHLEPEALDGRKLFMSTSLVELWAVILPV